MKSRVICDWCGKEFERKQAQIKKHNYCCRACLEKQMLSASDYIKSKNVIIAAGSLNIGDATRKGTSTSSAVKNAAMPLKQDRSLFYVTGVEKQSREKKAQFTDLVFTISATEGATKIS